MRQFAYRNTQYGKTEGRIFDSLADMIGECQRIPQDRSEVGAASITSSSFVGRKFSGLADAYAALQTVWTDGIEIVDRMTRELDSTDLPKPVSRRRKPRFSEDDGDELDYDRLRTGRAFWRTSRRQNTRGPATVTVVVDVCASCRVDHQDILWRGAAAIALTKRLEEAGYRVELWASMFSKENYRNSTNGFVAVCLKRPNEPLDESTLVNAVSGWGFRSLWFQASCLGTKQIHPNLGYPRAPTAQELDHITPDTNRVLIADAWKYEDAVAQVYTAVEKLTTN